MTGRTVILSDLHLGRSRRAVPSARALRPFWDGAAHLVVNGDVAEVHHPRHRAAAARETMRLFDLCERDGVELTLLSGNHDPFISDLRHLTLAEGRVFVTHGDVLHPAVAPWSPASGRIRRAHEAALAALAPEAREGLEARLSASQHASFAEWSDLSELEAEAARSSLTGMLVRPWAIAKVLLYWRAFPALAAGFVARHAPQARVAVLGHTHRPGVWRRGERVIVNTGSFAFPGRPLAVAVEGGVLTVHRVRRQGDRYALVAEGAARFGLREAAEEVGAAAPAAAAGIVIRG